MLGGILILTLFCKKNPILIIAAGEMVILTGLQALHTPEFD